MFKFDHNMSGVGCVRGGLPGRKGNSSVGRGEEGRGSGGAGRERKRKKKPQKKPDEGV